MSNVGRTRSRAGRLSGLVFAIGLATAVGLTAAGTATAAEPGGRVVVDLPTNGPASPTTLDGWGVSYNSGTQKPKADVAVVDHALRVSNATAFPFGDSVKTPPLAAAAGEPDKSAAVDTFDATFTVASETGGYQEGLNTEVALDTGTFSRDGGLIELYHHDGKLEIGTYWLDPSVTVGTANTAYLWDETVFAEVDPTVAHTVRAVVDFVDGPDNDVVKFFVDGALAYTGTTWEHLNEVKGQSGLPIDRLSFSAGKSTAGVNGIPTFGNIPPVPGLSGHGFLFSGIEYSSYNRPAAPTAPTPLPTEPAAPLGQTPVAVPDAVLPLPASVDEGGQLVIHQGGFAPFENVAFHWYSTPVFAGWAQADATGTVNTTIAVPASLASGQTHTLQAVGQFSGFVANASIVIAAASDPALANTGVGDVLPFVLTGVGLLLAGALALTIRRRRRLS